MQMEIVETAALEPTVRLELLAMLSAAYDEELSCFLADIGPGTHLLGRVNGLLVSHLMIVTRTLNAASFGPLRTAYVELVATAPQAQRRGHASTLLQRSVALMHDYDLAALSPSDETFYAQLGWESWRGPLLVRTENDVVPTPDEQVMIMRLPRTAIALDLDEPLSIEWRPGEIW